MRPYVLILLLTLLLQSSFLQPTVLPVTMITPSYADTMSEQELEDWFNDDTEPAVDEVNEGELVFIPPPTDKVALATEASVTMTADSLQSGMVSLQQCYRNLDAVPEVDVVYRYNNMQQLRIVSSENIEDARVVGNSVQLKNVTKGAFVCIAAAVQLLEKMDNDTYGLSFGPYYRRFLDGYYPYHAVITINYPEALLEFSAISPSPRPHYELSRKHGELTLDTWFEGVLQVDITFKTN